MPWDIRPDSIPLTVEEVRTALWLEKGNVSKASLRLKVDSLRLRRYIRSSPRLSAELEEAKEQILDKAEQIVVEALEDAEDKNRQDGMAKFALTNLGSARGYGKKDGRNLTIKNTGSGTVVVAWEGMDFEEFDDEDDPKVIEHADE